MRVNFEIEHPHVNSDYAESALTVKNFIDGHGFTVGVVNLKDISNPGYIRLYVWANGFAMLLVPLYYLSGSIINALVLAQVIGIILLILGFLRLFKALDVGKLTQSIFLLFTAFVATPYSYLGTTDLITAGLFLWALSLTIEILIAEKRNTLKKIIISALLFFSVTLRYACIPNILIIPGFFILLSLITKNRKALITGITIFILAAIPTFIFFSVYTIAYYKTQDANGSITHFHFFWNALKLFDPFPLKAFYYTDPLDFRLPLNLFIVNSVRLFEYLLSVLLFGYLLWYFLKKRNWIMGLKERKSIDLFTMLSIVSVIIITGFLIFLTLTTQPLEWSFSFHLIKIWSYVYETRYFVIPILLVQISFFVLTDCLLKKLFISKHVSSFVLIFFIPSLLINIAYSSYTLYQCHTPNSYSYWHEGENKIAMYKIINLDAKKNPGVGIVLATWAKQVDVSDPTIYSWSTNVIYNDDSIIQGKYSYKKPLILYTLCPGLN